MPSTWLRKSSKLPYHQPSLMAELTTALAKTPVNSIPTIPPTPWHGNTSRVSSMVERDFQCTNILDTTLAISPINIIWGIPTKPAAGVMATMPTTAPIHNPSAEGLRTIGVTTRNQSKPDDAVAGFDNETSDIQETIHISY